MENPIPSSSKTLQESVLEIMRLGEEILEQIGKEFLRVLKPEEKEE